MLSAVFIYLFINLFWLRPPPTHRISLPKHKGRAGGEDEEGRAAPKTGSSADRLEVDLDFDASSELNFGYEFAQAEVMMKGMGSNGERREMEMAKEKR